MIIGLGLIDDLIKNFIHTHIYIDLKYTFHCTYVDSPL